MRSKGANMRHLLSLLGYVTLLGYIVLAYSAHGPHVEWGIHQLVVILLILLSDLSRLFSKGQNSLSRSSHGLVLSAFLGGASFGGAALLAYFVCTLFLLGVAPKRESLRDLGLSLFPLATTACVLVVALPPTPSGYFAAMELFFFLMLFTEPRASNLRTSFQAKLAAPGLALAIHFLALFQPLLVLLLMPVLEMISAAKDEEDTLLRRMHAALTRSRSKLQRQDEALKRTKQKLSQMEVLLNLSQKLAGSLDFKELRTYSVQSLQSLGLRRIRFVPELREQGQATFSSYPLGEEHGHLIVGDEMDPKMSRAVRVLVRLLSTTLQNASLHNRVVKTLRQLKASQKQLVAQNQLAAVGRLAAGVAHEVNTPLAAIKVSLESSLKTVERSSEKTKPKIERALKAVERARLSIERILQYTRGGRKETPRNFLPSKVLRDCLELLAERFERLGVRVAQTIEESPELFGVEHDFYGLVSNLLLNAAEAAQGSKDAKVWVHLKLKDRYCQILVEDSGEGIPAEISDRIFDSFFTTKEAGKGTGLGLSLVSEVIRKFEGTVEVSHSANLGGASFLVKLPFQLGPGKESGSFKPEVRL